ncbi:MAG: hypothetical protein P8Z41_00100 [Anaerolineales bacterium]
MVFVVTLTSGTQVVEVAVAASADSGTDAESSAEPATTCPLSTAATNVARACIVWVASG